jgi:uncharacterized protein (DUF1330 family)
MPAYVISEVEVRDAKLVETYRALAAATIAKYGGRYIVRGGEPELLEGAPAPNRFVVVEFPSLERARAWYRSPEYAEALEVRRDALDRRLILVDGVMGEPAAAE